MFSSAYVTMIFSANVSTYLQVYICSLTAQKIFTLSFHIYTYIFKWWNSNSFYRYFTIYWNFILRGALVQWKGSGSRLPGPNASSDSTVALG